MSDYTAKEREYLHRLMVRKGFLGLLRDSREITEERDALEWAIGRLQNAAPQDDARSGPSSTSSAEAKLVKAGVFAGMGGLRGLAEAHEFWAEQPYGTRFYYGPGGWQYLHRSVLEAAIKILDGNGL